MIRYHSPGIYKYRLHAGMDKREVQGHLKLARGSGVLVTMCLVAVCCVLFVLSIRPDIKVEI